MYTWIYLYINISKTSIFYFKFQKLLCEIFSFLSLSQPDLLASFASLYLQPKFLRICEFFLQHEPRSNVFYSLCRIFVQKYPSVNKPQAFSYCSPFLLYANSSDTKIIRVGKNPDNLKKVQSGWINPDFIGLYWTLLDFLKIFMYMSIWYNCTDFMGIP